MYTQLRPNDKFVYRRHQDECLKRWGCKILLQSNLGGGECRVR